LYSHLNANGHATVGLTHRTRSDWHLSGVKDEQVWNVKELVVDLTMEVSEVRERREQKNTVVTKLLLK
jgi:hypothetical protein